MLCHSLIDTNDIDTNTRTDTRTNTRSDTRTNINTKTNIILILKLIPTD